MMIRVAAHPDGWVHSLIVQDEAPRTVPETDVVLARRPDVELPFLRVDGGALTTPHDDRIAWRRLCQLHRPGHVATASARTRTLGGLPDCGPVAVPTLPGVGISHDYPDGAHLRPLKADDLDALAGSGRCPNAETPCCRPSQAHGWLTLAAALYVKDTWQVVLELNGRPLHAKIITISGALAQIDQVGDLAPALPDSERPLLTALQAVGVTTVAVKPGAERSVWAQVFQAKYGAVEAAGRLRVDIVRALAHRGA
jgi:hypothetical protein